MPTEDYIPSKTVEFDDYIEIVIPYLYANRVRLVITTPNLQELYSLWGVLYPPPPTPPPLVAGNWKEIFGLWIDPLSETKPIDHQVAARKTLIADKLRSIYNDIPVSHLTDDDYDVTGKTHPDTTRTPAPVPTAVPTIEIHRIFHSHTTLRIRNPATPDTQKKPHGVQSTEIEALVLNADNSINEHKVETTGRFLFTMAFSEEQTGKKVRFRGRYKNNRGQQGPFSAYVDSVIA